MIYVIVGFLIITLLYSIRKLTTKSKPVIEKFSFFNNIRKQFESMAQTLEESAEVTQTQVQESVSTTPDDTTPDDTTRDDTTPDDTTPDDATPDDTTPDDATPVDATPDDTLPTKNIQQVDTGRFVWKTDNEYSKMHAYNLHMNNSVIFDDEVVLKGKEVSFQKPVFFTNDIYLYGNSLKFNDTKDTTLTEQSYIESKRYIDALNLAFSDEDYELEQDDISELRSLGLTKKTDDQAKCSYFNKEKDQAKCINKIWRRLRKKDVSNAPVCNCCCSPDTDATNCIVQLIKSDNRVNKEPYILQLQRKGELLYNITDQVNEDYLVQISLQKSDDIQTCKLLFFNQEKRMGETDNRTGLVKMIFSDEFDGKIIEYPRKLEIKSIKLIIE